MGRLSSVLVCLLLVRSMVELRVSWGVGVVDIWFDWLVLLLVIWFMCFVVLLERCFVFFVAVWVLHVVISAVGVGFGVDLWFVMVLGVFLYLF